MGLLGLYQSLIAYSKVLVIGWEQGLSVRETSLYILIHRATRKGSQSIEAFSPHGKELETKVADCYNPTLRFMFGEAMDDLKRMYNDPNFRKSEFNYYTVAIKPRVEQYGLVRTLKAIFNRKKSG